MRAISGKVKQFAKNVNSVVSDNSMEQARSDANHAAKENNSSKAGMKFAADEAARKALEEGAEILVRRSNEYRAALKEMTAVQVEMLDRAKILTQKSKDYANQVGDALARIDKVMVKDFEAKLLLLERFVVASKEMADLEKSGALQRIAASFGK